MADNIGTTNIWPYYSAQNVQTAARKPVKELGRDEFLQILITQLRNQDPMQPLQDKEFIAQMAQFSSLEQMVNMTKEVSALRQSAAMSAALIGKEISWFQETQAGTEQVTGVVTSIVWRDGVQYASASGTEVNVEDILSIAEPLEAQPQEPGVNPDE